PCGLGSLGPLIAFACALIRAVSILVCWSYSARIRAIAICVSASSCAFHWSNCALPAAACCSICIFMAACCWSACICICVFCCSNCSFAFSISTFGSGGGCCGGCLLGSDRNSSAFL